MEDFKASNLDREIHYGPERDFMSTTNEKLKLVVFYSIVAYWRCWLQLTGSSVALGLVLLALRLSQRSSRAVAMVMTEGRPWWPIHMKTFKAPPVKWHRPLPVMLTGPEKSPSSNWHHLGGHSFNLPAVQQGPGERKQRKQAERRTYNFKGSKVVIFRLRLSKLICPYF